MVKKGTAEMQSKPRFMGYRTFYPEKETLKRLREAGIDLYSIMVSNAFNALGYPYTKYPMVWTAPGTLDLAAAEAPYRDILQEIPDAKFICNIDLNVPLWWVRFLGAHGARLDSYYEVGKLAESAFWRSEIRWYLQSVLSHLNRTFRGHIVAFHLQCGGGTEWHDRCRGGESLYRFHGFRRWMKERHGVENADIPSMGRREYGRREFFIPCRNEHGYWYGYKPGKEVDELLFGDAGGLFYDPAEQWDVIEYFRYCNESLADAIIEFLGTARGCVDDDVQLGITYGYVVQEGQYNLSCSGHMAYERILRSGLADFMYGPASARMGEGSSVQVAAGTMHAYGKQALNCVDTKTHTSKGPDGKPIFQPWVTQRNDREVAAGIKRAIGHNLAEQNCMLFFDLWGGSYSPESIRIMGQGKKLWDRFVHRQLREVSEILMVVDPDNIYAINNLHPASAYFTSPWKKLLDTSGAPFSCASFDDLPKLEMKRFKTVIFCHPFRLGPEKREILEHHVCRDNRTVCWTYGPGIIGENGWDEKNVEAFCGKPFGTPGLPATAHGTWNSVYVHNPASIQKEEFRELLKQAGVFFYCDKPRPVFANEKIVAVHTAVAETLRIVFPERHALVTEAFSGAVFKDTDIVNYEFSGPDTAVFVLDEPL